MFFYVAKKRFSGIFIFSFLLLPSLVFANEKKGDLKNILIPPNVGIIKDSYDTGSDKTVVYIQDAHCVYSVQKNIISLIKLLNTQYDISFVASEGVNDKVDAVDFRSFPLKDTLYYVSNKFLKNGLINGAEYLSITDKNDLVVWGIDDPELYKDNLEAYKGLLNVQQEAESLIDSCSSYFLVIGQHIYNNEFKEFDAERQKFQKINNKSNIKLYSDSLRKFAQKQNLDLSKYNHFNRFYKCIEAKESINYQGVQTDSSAIYRLIMKNIQKDKLSEFMKKDLFAKINRISMLEYYNYLTQTADRLGLSLNEYKDFQQYHTYLEDIDKLHYAELLKQCKNIEQEIAFSFLDSKVQKDCYLYSRAIDILGRFFNLNLSNEDISFYNEHKSYFSSKNIYGFLKSQSSSFSVPRTYIENAQLLDNCVACLSDFYVSAKKRDNAMVSNMLRKMNEHNADKGVIVAGGFHREGLKKLFKENNVNYIEVMPQVDAVPEKASYIDLLNGGLSFDNLIDYTFGDSSLAVASWMEDSPIVNKERKRKLGAIFKAQLVGTAVVDMSNSDIDFLRQGTEKALQQAKSLLNEWHQAHAPSVDLVDIKKVGTVLFVVVNVNDTPIVFTYYDNLDYVARQILPHTRIPLDIYQNNEYVQEILPYQTYRNILDNSAVLPESLEKPIALFDIQPGLNGLYTVNIDRKGREKILSNPDLMEVIYDIGTAVTNKEVAARLDELEQSGKNKDYLNEFFAYYGNLIIEMANLLHGKYDGVDDRLWFRLGLLGDRLTSVSVDEHLVSLDINTLRSAGLLFANIEHGFLFNVYEPHVVRALKTFEMTEDEIAKFKNAVIEFFVTLKQIERLQQFGYDRELGDKTLRAMMALIGTPYISRFEFDLLTMNDEQRFEHAINVIKQKYPNHKDVIERLESEQQNLLKNIKLKLEQSLLDTDGQFQFTERPAQNVIDIDAPETIDEAAKLLKDYNVEFVEIKFLAPGGEVKGVLGSIDEINDFLENGIGFDGSSISGFGYISKSDMVARIDPKRLKIYKAKPGEPVKASIWAVPMDPKDNVPRELKNPIDFRTRVPKAQSKDDVIALMKDKGIKSAQLAIVDSTGHLKYVSVPLADLEKNDIWKTGINLPQDAAVDLPSIKATRGLKAIPDPATMRILDWNDGSTPELFMYVNMTYRDGKPFEGDFRAILKQSVQRANDLGFQPIMAPEPEFFLLDKNGNLIDEQGYYSDLEKLAPAIRNTLQDIMQGSKNAGLRVRYTHHEVAPGQYEIPIDRSDAMTVADNIMLYKEIVRKAAERNGLSSTFRAKVKPDENGSGMHVHQSLIDVNTGENLFSDASDPMKLSALAKQYAEGLMEHAREISALTNQYPNSYQRLTPGYEAPIAIAWGLRNRSALVRVPGWPDKSKGAARIEYRAPDPMGTTHLTFAALINAGIDGIENGLMPRQPVSDNIYKMNSDERDSAGITSLPTSMDEAVNELEQSEFVKSFLPEEVRQFIVFRGRKLEEQIIDIGETETIEDAAKAIKEYNVKFIEVKFVDPTGKVHSVLSPADFAASMLEDGVGFDGSSIEGYGGISASDMAVRIDAATLRVYEGKDGAPNYATIWATAMHPEENIPRQLNFKLDKFQKRHIPQSAKEVIDMLEQKGIDKVRFAVPDHLGNVQFQEISLENLKNNNIFENGFLLDEAIREALPTMADTSNTKAIPDIASLRILDLQDGSPLEAIMMIDIINQDGSPLKDFRTQLKNLEQKAKELFDAEVIMAPEPEFFLLKPDGSIADTDGYYDEIGGMDVNVQNVMREILLAAQSLGIDTRYVHHEVAPSQYEIPVGANTALETADNTLLFKWVVERIARKYGLQATFNPKPVAGENGSGMHVHQSLRSLKTGENLFADTSDKIGLSDMGKSYVAGLLKYIREITALTDQTPDSYKRLVPGFEAPIAVAWGPKNRTASVRIPGWADPKLARAELRAPDPSGNPHLVMAAMLAAGIKGIEDGLQPPAPITSDSYADGNIYHMTSEQRAELGITSLPTNLAQATKLMSESQFVKDTFGEDLVRFLQSRLYYELGNRLDTGTVKTADDVLKAISDFNVEFIEIKFPDPQGGIKGVYAPVGEIESFLKEGIGFDGSSIEGFGYIFKSDMVARLDPSSFRVFEPQHGEPLTAVIWAIPMDPDDNVVRQVDTADQYSFRQEAKNPENAQQAYDQLISAGIETIKLSVTDMSGNLKFVDVPVENLKNDGFLEKGIKVPKSITGDFGDLRVSKRLRMVPDVTTLRILDWKDGEKEAFMYVDLKTSKGKEYRSNPRAILKNELEALDEMGYTSILAPEPEFFLLNPDGSLAENNGYYDVASGLPANIKRTLRDILAASQSVGMRMRYAHHEVAPSQYEIPMERKPALEMADDIMLYKYIVQKAAERNGLKAVFNAKVFPGENGSGMHVHQSLVRNSDGKNAFATEEDRPSNLSPLAESYAAGILKYAGELMALTNQSPNSFERLVPGYEAPVYPVMGPRNRSAMVRIPGWPDESKGASRVEFRMPDAMGTTHLTFAAMLHAARMGIMEDLQSPVLITRNLFEESAEDIQKLGIPALPTNYNEAIDELAGNTVMRNLIGEQMVRYLVARSREIKKQRSMETKLSDFAVRVDEYGNIQTVSAIEQKRVKDLLTGAGVVIDDSTTTYISPNAQVGAGTYIGQNVTITGKNIKIGENVRILDGARIENISDFNLIIEDGSVIGPGVLLTGGIPGADNKVTVISGQVFGDDLIGFVRPEEIVRTGKTNLKQGLEQAVKTQRVIMESL